MIHTLLFLLFILLVPVIALFFSKEQKTKQFCIFLSLAVLACELFIFNLSSWSTLSKNYDPYDIDLQQCTMQGFTETEGGIYTASGPQTAVITVPNIDAALTNVYFNADITASDAVITVKADVSDSTNAALRYDLASQELISDYDASYYMPLRLSGQAEDLRLRFELTENEQITLYGVQFNAQKPIRFSLLRTFILLSCGLFLYAFANSALLKAPVAKRKKENQYLTVCITVALLGIAFVMVACYGFAPWKATSGNQITQSIVDAFRNGQVELLQKPSETLLALENPYDWSLRSEAGVSYLWDHCLYNGNYYSYYGIAPVLLLFLPYNLLTGFYFPTPQAVLLFSAVGIVFLSLLWTVFVEKFFPTLPIRVSVLGLLTVQFASGVWFCLCSPLFYEIAQSSAFMFTVMGAYFLLRANLIGEGKIRIPFVGAGTACLALAVLCRPTTAVYCVVSLLFLFFGLRKMIRETESTKRKVLYLVNATVFFALFGGIQMIYNYLRFDSFLDFGIQYSLTINDFTQSQFHARFVSIGIYNYILNTPKFSPEFPYVSNDFETLHPNGYYFVANKYAVGLIYRALPCLALLAAPSAWKKCGNKNQKRTAALLIGALSIAAPFVVLFSIWESGYGARYCMDFTWEILFGAFFIAFYLYTKSQNDGLKRWADRLLLGSTALSFLICIAQNWQFLSASLRNSDTVRLFAIVENIMNFWM